MDPGAAPVFDSASGLVRELATELKNHAYGLHSHAEPAIVCQRPLRAGAALELLEGAQMAVVLDADGYEIVDGVVAVGCRFGSLTQLLQHVSPAFGRAMHAAIVARLLALQRDGD